MFTVLIIKATIGKMTINERRTVESINFLLLE